MSEQSSRKQKERSCTGLQHGPCKWGVRSFFRTRGSCTDRAREETVQHGSFHGPCSWFGSARVSSTWRIRKACALIFRVARGVLFNTDRVRYLACTGLGRLQHGACWAYFQHGACELARVILGSARVQLLLHGSCNFLFFWGRKPNLFSVFRVYYDLIFLIELIKDPMNEFGWVEDLIVNPDNPNWELDCEL